MNTITFEALGTLWNIIIESDIPQLLEPKVISIAKDFEQKYSRFDPNSILSQYNTGKKIKKTHEFTQLIEFGHALELQSHGYFNNKVGHYLGKLGYGTGTQNLDFGAYGKGWLIDTIAQYLKENKYPFFLINAGGDIYATQKTNGDSWNVALEHPTNTDMALGTVELKNTALAASSPFKRKWNNNNHLLNGTTGTPIQTKRSVFTQAINAKTADALATTLNVVPHALIPELAETYSTEFLIIENEKILKSTNFICQLFI